jgi:hypothetical protein
VVLAERKFDSNFQEGFTMHLGYFFVAILVGWAYASLTEKPSTGPKVFGPWDMNELIRHGLIVGGAILGIILLVIFTNSTPMFEDGEEKTAFTLYEVSGVAIGAIVGAVLAGDIWRVVSSFMGGGKSGGTGV